MPRKVSICVLLYGDHPELAKRCLGTLGMALASGARYVHDVRLGLNVVDDVTRAYVEEWTQTVWDKHRFRVLFYIPDQQVAKYPLMRRMFYDEYNPLAELVMWFDDDTYFHEQLPHWWSDVLAKMEGHHMLGQCNWRLSMQGEQWAWIKTQPWYNPVVGMPEKRKGRYMFRYCQGAWWVIRRTTLHDLNWPIPELRHNGGDSMLGEALRHQGLSIGYYDRGLRINADERGRNSRAKRRGISEPVIGKHYKGKPLPVDHQKFGMQTLIYGRCKLLYAPDPVKVIDLPCW